jgi:hypothetical protein
MTLSILIIIIIGIVHYIAKYYKTIFTLPTPFQKGGGRILGLPHFTKNKKL